MLLPPAVLDVPKVLCVLALLIVLKELEVFDVLGMLAGFAVLVVCCGTVSELSTSGGKSGILS